MPEPPKAVAVAQLLLSHHCIKPRSGVTDEHVVGALATVLAVTSPRSDHRGSGRHDRGSRPGRLAELSG